MNRSRLIAGALLVAVLAASSNDALLAASSVHAKPLRGFASSPPAFPANSEQSVADDARVENRVAEHQAGGLSRCEFVAPRMGTLFQIVVYAPDAATAQPAAVAAFARIAELNRIFSDYDPNSEIMRLSRQPTRAAVPVSAELFEILQRSQQLAEQSGGAFDVTVGAIVRLWREARRTRHLPTEAARAEALQASGHRKLRLDSGQRTVTLLAPGMQLDFGGIAKGFAAGEALAVLAQHGFPCAMVAASGDLALGDPPPGKPGWRVEIAPFSQSASEPLVLVAANVGISTSGDAEQFVEIAGTRYSHIVDPATALGLTVPVAVTVIAREATSSDSLATACSVQAARQPGRPFDASLIEGALAFVHRRDPDGAVHRETHGRAPPGLLTMP